MGEEGGSVGPATYFFVTDRQKCDYLSRASQHVRGATKNLPVFVSYFLLKELLNNTFICSVCSHAITNVHDIVGFKDEKFDALLLS